MEPEYCWFIYGFKIMGYTIGYLDYQSMGNSCSVDFDWNKIMKNPKNFLGFFHTHPSGFHNPSETDHKTMKGWLVALGKPLLCGISCDNFDWLFLFEKNKPERVIKFKQFLSLIIYKNPK